MAKKPKREEEKKAQKEVFSHFSPIASNIILDKTKLLALHPGIQVSVPLTDSQRSQFSAGYVYCSLEKVYKDETAEIRLSGYDDGNNEIIHYKIYDINKIKPILRSFEDVTREHIITLAENTLFDGRYLSTYEIDKSKHPSFLKELGSFTFMGFKQKDFIWCMDQFWNVYIILPNQENLNLHYRIENLPYLHTMLRMWGYDLYGYNQ